VKKKEDFLSGEAEKSVFVFKNKVKQASCLPHQKQSL
jgi:hypothetical protein